jgi:hypothetical protein
MQKIKFAFKNPFEERMKSISASTEQYLAKIVAYVMNLSPRERFAVIGGSVFVVLFILIVGIIGPLLHARSNLGKAVMSKDRELKKIYQMSAEIRAMNASKGSKDGRSTLIGSLEELSKQLNLTDRVEYMKPISDSTEANRDSVEVKMRGLYQEDLINLLFGIENSPNPVKIKRLILKKAEKGDVLEVTFQAVSYG